MLNFSETSKLIYCYPCKMCSGSKSKLTTGFQNWKNNGITLTEYEMSKVSMRYYAIALLNHCIVAENLQITLQV